jgi:hypothetical protein
MTHTPRVKNPREAGAYTFGYNYSVFVQRVRDVLSAVNYVKNQPRPGTRLSVVGLDGAGAWVAAARAQCGGSIDQAVIDTGGFRFSTILDLWDPNFLPGGAEYGDLPALIALGAPGRLFVAGEAEGALTLAKAQYQATEAENNLTRFAGQPQEVRSAALGWLLAEPGGTQEGGRR